MRDPYRQRITRPLPREELAPVAATADAPPETRPALEEAAALAREAEDDIVTMARCPLCVGAGLVTPEIAATFDSLCRKAKERA